MLSLRKLLLLTVSIAAVGCTADRRSITSPDGSQLSTAGDPSANRRDGVDKGWKESVSGSAYFHPVDQAISDALYSVRAKRQNDGTIKGELDLWWSFNGGERIHGSIECFTIVGNVARLAARVDESNDSNIRPGSFLVWTIVDNTAGDDHDARRAELPDMTSFLFLGDQTVALAHCASGFNMILRPSSKGDLEVIGAQ
jgi:hypothetical protein